MFCRIGRDFVQRECKVLCRRRVQHDIGTFVFDSPRQNKTKFFGSEVAGARLLGILPPYPPDLNPIEQAFAKIKHWMRTAQTQNRRHTWRHVGSLVQSIEPGECNNYFANAGYASVKM